MWWIVENFPKQVWIPQIKMIKFHIEPLPPLLSLKKGKKNTRKQRQKKHIKSKAHIGQ